jgi:hypothetical protein
VIVFCQHVASAPNCGGGDVVKETTGQQVAQAEHWNAFESFIHMNGTKLASAFMLHMAHTVRKRAPFVLPAVGRARILW